MEKSTVKIAAYDIETSPIIGYTWGLWEQNVVDTKEEWRILAFSYKWIGDAKTHVYALCDFPLYKKDPKNDYAIVEKLWQLFNEADIILGHNSDEFDNKKVFARFIKHGFKPPTPYKTIDTKKIAKRYFKFDSNKLDNLGKYLDLGSKLKTGGFDLWLGCMAGNRKDWALMKKYNKQDVVLLEKVYLKMLPYITNHPNLNLLNGTTHNCPNCGSPKTIKRGFAMTRVSKCQRLQCNDCGAWCQGNKILR